MAQRAIKPKAVEFTFEECTADPDYEWPVQFQCKWHKTLHTTIYTRNGIEESRKTKVVKYTVTLFSTDDSGQLANDSVAIYEAKWERSVLGFFKSRPTHFLNYDFPANPTISGRFASYSGNSLDFFALSNEITSNVKAKNLFALKFVDNSSYFARPHLSFTYHGHLIEATSFVAGDRVQVYSEGKLLAEMFEPDKGSSNHSVEHRNTTMVRIWFELIRKMACNYKERSGVFPPSKENTTCSAEELQLLVLVLLFAADSRAQLKKIRRSKKWVFYVAPFAVVGAVVGILFVLKVI